jgi:hypothetical protein
MKSKRKFNVKGANKLEGIDVSCRGLVTMQGFTLYICVKNSLQNFKVFPYKVPKMGSLWNIKYDSYVGFHHQYRIIAYKGNITHLFIHA